MPRQETSPGTGYVLKSAAREELVDCYPECSEGPHLRKSGLLSEHLERFQYPLAGGSHSTPHPRAGDSVIDCRGPALRR